MATVFQTIDQLETLFAGIVTDITGLPENCVLIQYQSEGQPSSRIGENVAYVSVSQKYDSPSIYKSRTRNYNTADETYTYTQKAGRTLSLQVIFYGPDCYELCALFNEKMYFENTRYLLSKNNLSFIPDRTSGPVRLTEFHNERWWQRCDTTLEFYNLIVTEEIVGTFKELDIKTEVN